MVFWKEEEKVIDEKSINEVNVKQNRTFNGGFHVVCIYVLVLYARNMYFSGQNVNKEFLEVFLCTANSSSISCSTYGFNRPVRCDSWVQSEVRPKNRLGWSNTKTIWINMYINTM